VWGGVKVFKKVCLLFSVFIFIFWYSQLQPSAANSFFSKKEWANLQTDLQSSDLNATVICSLSQGNIYRFNGSDIFISQDKRCKILLNSNFSPYVKVIGNLHFCNLDRNDIKCIKNKTEVSKTVLTVLYGLFI